MAQIEVSPTKEFAFAENTAAFLPVFKQALIRRGIPERLYVDNGANYRSRHLALVCAKLGVALIHARPHQPQGKGKIERYFRTLRATLLTQLSAGDSQNLETLIRRLGASLPVTVGAWLGSALLLAAVYRLVLAGFHRVELPATPTEKKTLWDR